MDRAPEGGDLERRLEGALQQSEERFRRLVDAAKDYAIFMVDADGRVTTWNEGAERLFGYEEGEVLGEDASLLFTPEDRESGAPERELGKARTEGRAEDERWHVRKDGSRFWASGLVRPMRDEEGNLLGFSKVAHDVTERERSERALGGIRGDERKRLARELHDGPLQDLAYGLAEVRVAARDLGDDEPGSAAAAIGRASGALRRVSDGLRAAVNDLRQPGERAVALPLLVEVLVERMRGMDPACDVRLEVQEGLPSEPVGDAETDDGGVGRHPGGAYERQAPLGGPERPG